MVSLEAEPGEMEVEWRHLILSEQKEAERNAYWETPEGKKEFEARRAEIRAIYEK
jgi:hypothetical protein